MGRITSLQNQIGGLQSNLADKNKEVADLKKESGKKDQTIKDLQQRAHNAEMAVVEAKAAAKVS